MRGLASAFYVAMALALAPAACEARARITVDLSSQTMSVDSSSGSYSWPISSARDGYVTPRGTYGVQSLQTMHYSKKYHNSPMPHSIFFYGGYAIHGTYDQAHLGQPASHGCVRISPENAATLYSVVRAEGGSITIVGEPPSGAIERASIERAASDAPQPRRGRAARAAKPKDDSLLSIFGAIISR